jgi:hypothetical protein
MITIKSFKAVIFSGVEKRMVKWRRKREVCAISLLYKDSFRSAAKSSKLITHDKHLDVKNR